MIKKISKTAEIKARMRAANQISYLDQPHHIKAIEDMNSQLEAVRREFQVKDKNSQITASKVVLTA